MVSYLIENKLRYKREENILGAVFYLPANQHSRAQPDITSGPEVRQFFKIRTVRKPDVFLPERRTVKTSKNQEKYILKKKLKK